MQVKAKSLVVMHKRRKENFIDEVRKKAESFLVSHSPAATATKFLLMFTAIGGISIVGATLPGLVKAIGFFANEAKKKNRYPKVKIKNSFEYLKKKQFIEIVKEKNGKIQVRLTNKGKKRLAEYSLDMLEIKKPEKWDGKWRVLMFDIPAHPKKYDYARDALRDKVKELGFYQIQKSVWVYPYECEDELLFIAEVFKVQQYIEILTVEKLLHENLVRKKFTFL
ncbi:MAG: hypothetical protein A3J06_01530 [Candidatus Moranbacteria bacterium RIFCSPLOWO2_02_FULL_48_19]|nr:MAG: hypothetical protein A3J06_01530 [Candidatus Moranbacteria bacterium RIFCSPLOWO2_02_FULL_48_19]OGI31092.1 MAG: hypothetical protein A3G09_00085 [Candidatus Moranbacteria bacterium RIFCSPLOWO2_12_FULL_48_12]